MVGGVVGVVLTGVFASLVVNASGASGGWLQLGRQTLLALVALGWPFVMICEGSRNADSEAPTRSPTLAGPLAEQSTGLLSASIPSP
jgi:hypothetical protein